MSFRETINGTTCADRLLLTVLLLVSLLGIVFVREVLPHPAEVSIDVEGKKSYRYPLGIDRRVRVESSKGHLTVEIKGERVRVINASCPNRNCELQGWTGRGAIICLPNRISISVGGTGNTDGGKLDAVTG